MCSTTRGRSRTGVNDPPVGAYGFAIGAYGFAIGAYGFAVGVCGSVVSAYGSLPCGHGSAVAGEVAFPAWTWTTSTPSACPAMWHA